MSKKNDDILSILAKRAEQASNDKFRMIHFDSETFGEIEFERPALKKITEWIDDFAEMENPTTYDGLLFNARIFYESFPFIKNNFKQLSEMYSEDDPERLTLKIFKEANAIYELNPLAEKILSSYGAYKEEIKN